MRSWQKRALTGHTALKRARALIEQPEAWTQHRARRLQYFPGECAPRISFCLTGAIAEVSWPDSKARREATDAIKEAIENITGRSFCVPSYWNDYPHRTHAEVLAALDLAIELS